MKPILIIASLLDGHGSTGVETHFRLIMQLANQSGIEVMLITPHSKRTFLHRLGRLLVKSLHQLSRERAALWYLQSDTSHLKYRLHQVLSGLAGRHVTIYAQDPHSAKAALAARISPTMQVISIVHYNISEANEIATKGLTAEGRPLWQQMMQTEREILPQVDKLIFVSNFMRLTVNQRLQNLSSTPQIVIPNFSALPWAEAGKGSLISGDIITIGSLEPRKNQSFLLYVLAECKALGKHYTMTVVGDGPDHFLLERLAIKLGIAEQIKFLGIQNNAARFIPAHRVLVHAARMESFGIVLIEAMSYKRPVLAAPVGGIPEVFTDGLEGKYWDIEDPHRSAEILISILDDSKKWQMMSDQAGKTFATHFHPDLVGKRWMETLLGI
jgi:glycosyltransferase involved in cell wall biosynthesis